MADWKEEVKEAKRRRKQEDVEREQMGGTVLANGAGGGMDFSDM